MTNLNPTTTATSATPTRLARVVIASFFITAALIHLVAGWLLPHVHGGLSHAAEYTGQLRSAGVQPDRQPTLAVIGTSLSGMQQPVVLADLLQKRLGFQPNEIARLNFPARNIADLFAEMLRAEWMGARIAVVEINPFIMNDRKFRLRDERSDLRVTTEEDRAITIFAHVPWHVQLEILRQLGINGLLNQLFAQWSPARYHAIEHRAAHTSSIVGGMLAPVRTILLGHSKTRTDKRRKQSGTEQSGTERDSATARWRVACNNFLHKPATGLDVDVLSAMFGYAVNARLKYIFFVPPMNRSDLEKRCGPDAVANLAAVIAQIQARAKAAAVEVLDLSNALDDEKDVFLDYGHCKPAKDRTCYARWTQALGPRIERALHGAP